MSNEINKMIIPKLRFEEFKDRGEWEEMGIGKLFKFKQGVQVPVENQHLTKNKSMVRFIRIIDITSNSEPPRYIEHPGNDHLIQKADLVMIRYGTPGLISVGFKGVIANNLFRLIWNFEEKFVSQFWFYAIQRMEKTIYNLSGSSSMPAISFSTLENLNIQFPNESVEQQKIADCLSSLDELITAENQKLEALKVHKKGLMQQLFPAEGETVPGLRFGEFRGGGEWEEKSIGRLFKFKQGVQVPVENQHHNKNNSMVRFIRIIDITNNSEPPRYIENPGKDHLIQKNDLFMIRYGTPGVISIGFEGVIANNLFRLIWDFDKKFISKFWFYAFQKMESTIYNLSGSSSMPAISFSTLENLNIQFPNEPVEQQEIADCLSSLDELFIAQTEKIEVLKRHKKGLMIGLFPNINE